MGTISDFTFRGRSLVRPVFIETGIYAGETTAAALAAGFESVRVIEVHEPFVRAAREKFAGDPRFEIHHGSSRTLLDGLFNPAEVVTFFLDGHYSGGDTAHQDTVSECPVIAELKLIFSRRWRWQTLPYVVIDDAHIFTRLPGPAGDEFLRSRNLNPAHWPRVEEIYKLLPHSSENGDDLYRIDLHDDRLYCLPVDG